MTQFDPNDNPAALRQKLASLRFPSPKAHVIFWPIVIIAAALDLWTKQAVFKWLSTQPDNEFSIIDGFFKLVMRLNAGAAFSFASGQRIVLVAVSVIALIMVLGIFLFGGVRRKITLTAIGLFTAGIMGNLYDRVFNEGLVRDFIDVYYGRWHWPAFNVADSMLCIGVGLILIANITSASSRKPAHQQK